LLLQFFSFTLWATVFFLFIFGNRKDYAKRLFTFFTEELICGHHTPPFVSVLSRCTQYVDYLEERKNQMRPIGIAGSGIGCSNLYPNRWAFSIKIKDTGNWRYIENTKEKHKFVICHGSLETVIFAYFTPTIERNDAPGRVRVRVDRPRRRRWPGS
jgi:hypothetical protein